MSFVLNILENNTELKKTCPDSKTVFFDEDNQKIMVGHVFHEEEKDFLNCGWEKNPAKIQEYDETAVLISYGGKEIVICSDLLGCQKVYYYKGKDMLCISDDFWEIVSEISPEFSDLNVENIRKRLLLGGGVTQRGNDY